MKKNTNINNVQSINDQKETSSAIIDIFKSKLTKPVNFDNILKYIKEHPAKLIVFITVIANFCAIIYYKSYNNYFGLDYLYPKFNISYVLGILFISMLIYIFTLINVRLIYNSKTKNIHFLKILIFSLIINFIISLNVFYLSNRRYIESELYLNIIVTTFLMTVVEYVLVILYKIWNWICRTINFLSIKGRKTSNNINNEDEQSFVSFDYLEVAILVIFASLLIVTISSWLGHYSAVQKIDFRVISINEETYVLLDCNNNMCYSSPCQIVNTNELIMPNINVNILLDITNYSYQKYYFDKIHIS